MTVEEREKSLANWDEVAAGWRKHNDFQWATTRHVSEWMVDKIRPQPGQTVLDLAAGPGDTGFTAAKLLGESGRLITTDFAPQMVEVAKGRARDLGITNAEFKQMDAEKMDLGDEIVDAVLCRWGFMLMLDPQSGLKECHRVLKPGGRIALSVWGAPEKNPWVTAFAVVMVQRGYPPQGDPFGPGGMFSMAEPEKVRSMLAEAGFGEIEVEEMPVHWRFGSFDDWWTYTSEVAGGIVRLIKELPSDEVEKLKEDLLPAIEPYKVGEGYDLPGVAVNAAASKA